MVKKIKEYINKSEFVKNSLTLFTGTTIAQIVPLVLSPVLSRIYTPEDFGVLALYMSIASILAVFATGRYEMAIVLPKKDSDAINIFSLSIVISVGLALLILASVLLFNSQIADIAGNKNISFYLYFLPLTVFSLGLFKALNYWFNRRNQFKNIAKSKVIASSGNSAIAVSIGFLKKGSLGLVFGWIFGQLSSALYMLGILISKERRYFSYIKKEKIIAVFKRYKKFPLFDTWSELLNVLSVQFPIIILMQYYGDNITGHYSFAYKVLLLPFSLLAFSMGQAFFKKANELKNTGKDVSAFTFGVFKKLVLISFLPLAVTGIFGDYIFPFIFGNEWIIAGEYSRIFSLWIFIIFISSPLTNLFAVYERQRTNLIFNFVMFVSRIGLLIFMSEKGYDDYSSIFVYVVSGFVFRFLYLLLIIKIAKVKIYNVFTEIFKYVIPAICILILIRVLLLKV
ncbi:MAG: oligosaccharide flippase family protein [Bacteroidales bacterium]|nr:oligosaccharide flippase family protein [Bacteroidales bacterium]